MRHSSAPPLSATKASVRHRNILLNTVRTSQPSYDETLRFLRLLEGLQPDHIEVLRAYDAEPPAETDLVTGSRRHTLGERLQNMSADHLDDLVQQLDDARLTTRPLQAMVTGPSAVDLRPLITPLGRRFFEYILTPDEP